MDNENIYDAVYKNENSNEMENSNYSNNTNNNKPSKKRRGAMGKIVAIIVSCSLLGGITGSGVTYLMLKNNNAPTEQNKQNVVNNIDTTDVSFKKDGALSITEAFQKVAPAVVTVSTKGVATFNGFFQQEVEGIGSGFIINEDGYILTNYHVIEGAKEVSVTLSDNTTVSAKVVNYDANQDVAMLKITDENVKVPAVAELGDSNALQQGEEVIAIGTPLSADLSQTVTNGIVSALNRNVETESGVVLNLIQTNASINPGNSGGPLVNTKGQVVGINTMKMSGENTEGIGFAIPINDISDKIESLSKPILNLGISIRTVDESLASQLKMEQGLYVVEVNEFSPAEKAGVKAGDLIVKVDGQRVKTFDELKEIKNSKNEGDSLKLEVIRDGKSKTMDVTLTSE
ncbi:trypsin-like peptidase domain-containing protein [Clostridium sp. NSJ-6]|uniref:Trypsin-like peptidase domain-containing protein n=1 Tax=Clostridium hominis TaxID=2763036 RepID=A0ABR7DFM3_9CLOT|nr:trypsin-like peptidase domain-containing protein [Clostridium hominis]MBC5630199.1 trypsin-like peptidase domain-containing protein [Clostridium hominis]MDU2671488.1 trypsin-like peptidase domain-containing protein [Clostridium sp.]